MDHYQDDEQKSNESNIRHSNVHMKHNKVYSNINSREKITSNEDQHSSSMLDKQNTCEYIHAERGNFYKEKEKRTKYAHGTDTIYDVDKMIPLRRADESDMSNSYTYLNILQFYPSI